MRPRVSKLHPCSSRLEPLTTLLAGEGFQVDDAVPTDGLTAIFTIGSNAGTFQAHGIEMLRLGRRAACDPRIGTNWQDPGVWPSLAKNGIQMVTAAGRMIMHPADTVKRIPEGIGGFFGRVGLGAQRLK